MILFLADIVAIAAVGLLVWRRGRDRRVGSVRSAQWLRIAGLVPLGLQVAFLLLFGIGEMASGHLSGAGHLLPAAASALLALLAWMRPLEGGVALIIAGVVTAIPVISSGVISPALFIMAAPQVVSGALFLAAGMLGANSGAGS